MGCSRSPSPRTARYSSPAPPTGPSGSGTWRHAELRAVWTAEAEVYGLAISPDGQTLATTHPRGRLTLWEVAQGRARAALSGHVGEVPERRIQPRRPHAGLDRPRPDRPHLGPGHGPGDLDPQGARGERPSSSGSRPTARSWPPAARTASSSSGGPRRHGNNPGRATVTGYFPRSCGNPPDPAQEFASGSTPIGILFFGGNPSRDPHPDR